MNSSKEKGNSFKKTLYNYITSEKYVFDSCGWIQKDLAKEFDKEKNKQVRNSFDKLVEKPVCDFMRTIANIEVKSNIDQEEFQNFKNKIQEIKGMCDSFVPPEDPKDLLTVGTKIAQEYRNANHSWISYLTKRNNSTNNDNNNDSNNNSKKTRN